MVVFPAAAWETALLTEISFICSDLALILFKSIADCHLKLDASIESAFPAYSDPEELISRQLMNWSIIDSEAYEGTYAISVS